MAHELTLEAKWSTSDTMNLRKRESPCETLPVYEYSSLCSIEAVHQWQ